MIRNLSRRLLPSQKSKLYTLSLRTFSSKEYAKNDSSSSFYLHIGPSGDCWTGSSIFAAKHLQPDYVKSILLPAKFAEDQNLTQILLDELEENNAMTQQIYDDGVIPSHLLHNV
mmetsp:Transcript_23054/g.35594  ORF Transcript_23054/g.35594 Transcript_23054/m.35594 type:complete len:114 (-) Transcript_23054:192-533(-)